VLCLIEAMKVFNDIKAEVGGVIQRVFLENGKPVKVGQEMFVIEKK
jgi:biotin carboxyl carrier protein